LPAGTGGLFSRPRADTSYLSAKEYTPAEANPLYRGKLSSDDTPRATLTKAFAGGSHEASETGL
jgi:hypothetical protein